MQNRSFLQSRRPKFSTALFCLLIDIGSTQCYKQGWSIININITLLVLIAVRARLWYQYWGKEYLVSDENNEFCILGTKKVPPPVSYASSAQPNYN
jgi:hypothetical protein